MLRTALLIVLVGLLTRSTIGQAHAAPEKSAGTMSLEQRSLKTMSGDVIPYELGTLYVPENRSAPNSRVIGVGFARIAAENPTTGVPPVLRLPGGPGSSLLSRLKSAEGKALERYLPLAAQLRKFSDVVLVDQRGFSEHGDIFKATLQLPDRRADSPHSDDEQVAAFKEFAVQTVNEYANGEVDLRGYTVKECAQDVSFTIKPLPIQFFRRGLCNGSPIL